jgi:hypothetical protein
MDRRKIAAAESDHEAVGRHRRRLPEAIKGEAPRFATVREGKNGLHLWLHDKPPPVTVAAPVASKRGSNAFVTAAAVQALPLTGGDPTYRGSDQIVSD